MKIIHSLLAATAAALATAATQADAAQIILTGNAVIGSTGGFDSSTSWQPQNILDQQTGLITEQFRDGHYWLNSDTAAIRDAFITIDLGQAYLLGRLDLFNTTNGFNDRGTGNFVVRASNSIVDASAPGLGKTLGSDAINLVTGTLARPTDPVVRDAQSFSVINDGVAYRYLQFRPLSTTAGSYSSTAYGLNELRVFDGPANAASPAPEPATWAGMVLGFGITGSAMRRRKRAMVNA